MPQYITDLLEPISDAHTRTLRSSASSALAVPRSRTSLFDRSYSYSAPYTVEINSYFSTPFSYTIQFQRKSQTDTLNSYILAS